MLKYDVGIQRLQIQQINHWRGHERFLAALPYRKATNAIYKRLFDLMDGEKVIECSEEDYLGRYDKDFGIDVVLTLKNGHSITVQEKCLGWREPTVTVEYYNDWRNKIEGDWFTLKCDFYVVTYGIKNRPDLKWWIILDWNQTKIHSDKIPWGIRKNTRDGAKSNFKWAYFNKFPDECVYAMEPYEFLKKWNPYQKGIKVLPKQPEFKTKLNKMTKRLTPIKGSQSYLFDLEPYRNKEDVR